MTDGLIDRAAGFAMRHDRALTIVGAVWFWTGAAVYARFIDLPKWLPEALRSWLFWLAAAYNAVWWGLVHPQIDRRRKALEGDAGERPDAAEG